MAKIIQNTIRPLRISTPNFDDPKLTAWARELENEINRVLIRVLEDNRQRIELGLSDGTKDLSVSSIETANGSASAPSFSFSNSTGTGMFLPSGNTLGFATNGAQRITVTSDGKVGIGTTFAEIYDVNSETAGKLRLNNGNIEIVNKDATIGTTQYYIGVSTKQEVSNKQIAFAGLGVTFDRIGAEDARSNLIFYTSLDNIKAERMRVASDGDIYSTGWTDYSASSTIVGWSSFTTKKIYYKKIGKLCFVMFLLSGTSDSTSVSFTVPFTNNSDIDVRGALGVTYDNGAFAGTGIFRMYSGVSTVACFQEAATGWTASGTKMVAGQFFYQTA